MSKSIVSSWWRTEDVGINATGPESITPSPSTLQDADWCEVSSFKTEALVPAEIVRDEPKQIVSEECAAASESVEQVDEHEFEEVEVATAVQEEWPSTLSFGSARAMPPRLRLDRTRSMPPPLDYRVRSTKSALRIRPTPRNIAQAVVSKLVPYLLLHNSTQNDA